MRYHIVKMDKDGNVYTLQRDSEDELVLHLAATFSSTCHKVLAVFNIDHTQAYEPKGKD